MSIKKLGTQIKIASDTITLNLDKAIDPSKTEETIIEKKDAEFIYFRARAISAGDQGPKDLPNPNGNGDYFPRKELESSYETFIGRNLFLNHDADHPIKSIGKILDAYEVEDPETGEYYIETLAKIDRKLHPEIARKVEKGELNTVSMGCSCESSMCSICGTVIHTDNDEKCSHLDPAGILKEYTAEINLPEYNIQKGHPMLAYSINSGLSFNELSIVSIPADEDAYIKSVIASNIKSKISKKASLDPTEVKHFNLLFANLDDKSKKCLTNQICSRELSKEEAIMSKKETVEKNQVVDVSDLQKNMNAFDYMRLEDHILKKNQKAVDSKKVNTSVKKSYSFIDKAINAVKSSPIGKIFENAVKKELKKASAPKTAVTAEFTKGKNFIDSHWTIFVDGKEVLKAPVKHLWASENLEKKSYQTWIASEKYRDKLLHAYEERGLEKLSKILNVTGKEVTDPKAQKEHEKSADAIESTDEHKVGDHLKKHEEEVVEEKKETKKEAGHKDDCDCNFCKNVLKKDTSDDKKDEDKKDDKEDDKKEDDKEASKKTADESVVEDATTVHEEVQKDVPAETPPDEALRDEPTTEEVRDKHQSAFDVLDEPLKISDAYQAEKDPQTNEIVVKDIDGNEVKRLDDGFGDDVSKVLELLKDILGIQEEHKDPAAPGQEEEVNVDKAPANNNVVEEPAQDNVPVDDSYMASKKNKLTKEAEEAFDKKSKELAEKEAEISEKQQKLNADKFINALAQKTKRCEALVEKMFKKEMIKFDKADFEVSSKAGKGIIDARKEATQKALRREFKRLLTLSSKDLNDLEAKVDEKQIKKEASQGLSSPLYTAPFTPKTEDNTVGDIFDTMGNGGGTQNFQ